MLLDLTVLPSGEALAVGRREEEAKVAGGEERGNDKATRENIQSELE